MVAYDWSSGGTFSHKLRRVDVPTWADADDAGGFLSASVERVSGGLLESGSVTVSREVGEAFEPGYYRLSTVAEGAGGLARADVATFYCASAGGEASRGADALSVECRSVLYPASVGLLLAGSYAPRGADGAEFAAGLLRECCACPVRVDGSFSLGAAVVFRPGCSRLEAAWTLLEAAGWRMRVDGGGEVSIGPMPSEPAMVLGRGSARIMSPGASHALDYSNVPNSYYADDGTQAARAVNDDPSSPTSTVSRGYVHDVLDAEPLPVGGEGLAAYARRKLRELSVVEDSRTYARAFEPGLRPYDVVRFELPDMGLYGDMRIKSQSLEFGRGISTRETAAREVRTWTG